MDEIKDYSHLWENFAMQRLVKKDGRKGMVVSILWWGLDTEKSLPGACFEVAWEVNGKFDVDKRQRIYGEELLQILTDGYGSMPPPHVDCPIVERLLKPLHKAGWKVSRKQYKSLLRKAQEGVQELQDAAAEEAARVAKIIKASRPGRKPVKRQTKKQQETKKQLQPKKQQTEKEQQPKKKKGESGAAAAAAADKPAGKEKQKQQKAKEAGSSKSKSAAAPKQTDKQQGQQQAKKQKEPKLAVKKTVATKAKAQAKAKPQGKAAAAAASPAKK